MLVLSRRVQQEIVFPHLGITISVLQVRGQVVKIGVMAPNNVKVLRQEVAESWNRIDAEAMVGSESRPTDDLDHRLRNQLNLLQLQLDAIQSRIERGEVVDAESMLQAFLRDANAKGGQLASLRKTDSPMSATKMLPSCDVASYTSASPATGSLRKTGNLPIRLFIVEDCDNERGLMAYVLASQGFIVHVARDGNEAIQQMMSFGSMPDYVLMDMQMPLANGIETLRRIRCDRRLANLKVFAVTGTRRNLQDEPLGRGWDGWFQKPLDIASLVKRIREDIAVRESTLTPAFA